MEAGYCRNCGMEASDADAYCQHCGMDLIEPLIELARWNLRSRRWSKATFYVGAAFWWVCIGLAGLVASVVGLSTLVPGFPLQALAQENSADEFGMAVAYGIPLAILLANGLLIGAPLMAVGSYLTVKSLAKDLD